MITAHISARSGRRIYIRSVYYGNCWSAAVSAVRDNLKLFRARRGLALSTVSGQAKLITPRTLKEVK